jgi:HEAT repeat protein
VRQEAAGALAELGARGRPAEAELRRALAEDAPVRTAAAHALGQLALAAPPGEPASRETVAALAKVLREDRDEAARLWAVRALRKFGPDAAAAWPALRDALRDEDEHVAREAADVLARLGPDAVPVLAEALRDDRCPVRREIADCLADFGPRARAAIPALVGRLKDEDPRVVLQAARALLRIDRAAAVQSVVPVFHSSLKEEKDRGLQCEVVLILGEIGPEARPAAPAICELLRVDCLPLRRRALAALGQIRAGRECWEPLLRFALAEKEAELRAAAAEALWHNGERRHALPILTEMLRDHRAWAGLEAVTVLRGLGPEARGAVPALRRLLHRPGDPARLGAALALWRVAPRVELSGVVFDPRQETFAVLADLARKPAEPDRLDAISAIGIIGSDEPAAVRVLAGLLHDLDSDVRGAAAAALGQIGPAAAGASAALERLLDDTAFENRRGAAVALCQIGGSRVRRAMIVKLLEKRPSLVCYLSDPAEALGSEAAGSVSFLMRTLRHDERAYYLEAAEALRRLDPRAADRAGVP